jgi:hypothetical protein
MARTVITSQRPTGRFRRLEVGTLDELATIHETLTPQGVLKGAVD